MPLSGLNWQSLVLRFDGSLETKMDVRVSSAPELNILRDAHFEEIGALQTRPPFGAVMGSGAIFGGGTLANCRKLAVVNGELCIFTDTGFYSWNAQLSQWVFRGTHLAVSVDETPRLATTGDQIEGDRAELSGTIVIAWTENGQVYAGAVDKVTGSVLVSPTAVSTAIGRPRLVALATKILLFVEASTTLLTVRAIDPATPSGGISGAGTTVLATNYNLYYDVARAGTQDLVVGACRRQTTTSYEVFTVTPGLVVTNSTKPRMCDGPIAVSTIPDGTKTQIVRASGTNIQGDLLTTSTLADVFTGQVIGGTSGATPTNQIAAAHRSVQDGGAFRCYVFWSAAESPSVTFRTTSNWVDSAGTLGTAGGFVNNVGIVSRAFDRGGRVFVWTAFAGVPVTGFAGVGDGPGVQNTAFLFRDDALLVAKALNGVAGGYAPSTGRLPGVVQIATDAYSWCSTSRRQVPLGHDGTGYSARANQEVSITFDSNLARRSAQLGNTLYITGGEVLQYDGARLVEVGFHVYPYNISPANGTPGSLTTGTYAYKVTARYLNAQSEQERSTTTTIAAVSVSGGATFFTIMPNPLTTTHKTVVPIALEFWRTVVNPGVDAPFYLITSKDPATAGTNNGYVANDPTVIAIASLTDAMADSTASAQEANPENETILEMLAPPPAKIIVPTETRLLLAGVAGDPDAWWYSRERGDGEIASFHDELRVEVPPVGGTITALWADDQYVYVGRQTALYAYAGPGKANDDSGQNYTLSRTISRDVGVVSQEAHAQTPVGRLFKSSKGWYVLDGISGGLRYVGGAVASFDSDTVVAVHTVTAKHQVRILTTSRLLVWDYRGLIDATAPGQGRWGEWSLSGGLDAVLYNGTYTVLTASGPIQETASYTGLTYGIDAELAWFKPADLVGYGKLGEIQVIGEYRSSCLVRVRVARDYQYDGSGNPVYFDDVAWAPSPSVVGSALQVRHKLPGWGEAFKIRITATAEQTRATLATASALSPTVQTSGTNWTATWKVADLVAGREYDFRPGEMGNAVTMSLAFKVGTTPSIDVRDHFAYDQSSGRWLEDLYNVGVLVTGTTTTTVAQLEAAIAAGTKLVALQTADSTPSKTLAISAMAALSAAVGSFGGGAYTAPTGEAVKLTGLGLLVGLLPGLKRLPAAQKV